MENPTVDQLRSELKQRGLKSTGVKSDLLSRISAANCSVNKTSDADIANEDDIPSDDYIDFKKFVTCELAALGSRIDNLGTPTPRHEHRIAELIAEIESLRAACLEKDAIIKALSVHQAPTPEPVWETVSATTRKSSAPAPAYRRPILNTWDPSIHVSPNRFDALTPEFDKRASSDSSDDVTQLRDETPVTSRPETPAPSRRPCVVVNPYPERQTDQRVVPGEKRYSEAHVRKVVILTDSICGGVRRPALLDELRSNGIDVDLGIHRHAGAQSHELHHYVKQHIADDSPHGLIIVGGTNDLPKRDDRRQLTDEQIADNIIATGQYAHSQGVVNIFISGITRRKGIYFEKRRKTINRILYEKCVDNDFKFIDNDNISLDHTDGLHLHPEGTTILKRNFIDILY